MKLNKKSTSLIVIIFFIALICFGYWKIFVYGPIPGVALNISVLVPKIYSTLNIEKRNALTIDDLLGAIQTSSLSKDEKEFYLENITEAKLSLVTINDNKYIKVEHNGLCDYLTESGLYECFIIEDGRWPEVLNEIKPVKQISKTNNLNHNQSAAPDGSQVRRP